LAAECSLDKACSILPEDGQQFHTYYLTANKNGTSQRNMCFEQRQDNGLSEVCVSPHQ